MDLSAIAEKALQKSKQAGAQDTAVSISSLECKEFNIEAGKLTLLRTTFDQNLSVKTVLGNRQASVNGNQFSEEGIAEVARKSMTAAEAASEIQGAGFAGSQGHHKFEYGTEPCQEDWIYDQMQNALREAQEKFPKIILNSTVKFMKTHAETLTSKGSHLSSKQNYYEGNFMFNAKDGALASSFNWVGFTLGADGILKSPSLMARTRLADFLKQSTEQLNVRKVPQKFEGDVIMTPHCLDQFLPSLLASISSGQMMKKTTPMFGKKNEKVISGLLTIEAKPRSDRFSSKAFWTADGYLTQDEILFDQGVLKFYLLNHQAATQLKETVSLSGGTNLLIRPGTAPLAEMIRNVKKGVLLCRYSSGMPAENGDVSGVAKNSYSIENGEIQYPLGETMVSMNVFESFKNIQAVSKEVLNSGYNELPWLHMTGAHIS